jgi:hypothetical protein
MRDEGWRMNEEEEKVRALIDDPLRRMILFIENPIHR